MAVVTVNTALDSTLCVHVHITSEWGEGIGEVQLLLLWRGQEVQ